MSAEDIYHYLHHSPTFSASKFDIVGSHVEFEVYQQKIGSFDDGLIIDLDNSPAMIVGGADDSSATMFTGASTVDQRLKHIFGGIDGEESDEDLHESDEEAMGALETFGGESDIYDPQEPQFSSLDQQEPQFSSLDQQEPQFSIDDLLVAGEVLGGNTSECPIMDITEFFS